MADTSIYTDPTSMDKDNVQLSIWNGTKWVELSNGYTINQINTNIHEVADKVAEAQQGIAQATTDAQNAVDTANTAITQSGLATETATTAKQVADSANSVANQAKTDSASALSNAQTALSTANSALSKSDSNSTSITNINTDINKINGTLNIKANQTDVDKLAGRVSTAETNINQNAHDISLKANTTDVDTLAGRVSTAESNIDINAKAITQKISSSDVQNILDTKGYATQTWTNSAITQKANEITSTVTTLQNQVNASAVGTNLLLGSSDFSGTWKNISGNWNQNGTYKNLIVYTRNGTWNGVYQEYTVPTDGNYTFSAYAKQEASSVGTHIYPFVNGNGSGDLKISSTTFDWTRVSFTKNLKANDVVYFKVENDAIGKLSVCGFKLEKGSVATDYSTNPADGATVTALSIVSQKADSISQTVTNNKSASDSQFTNINQTISGIQSTVANKADSSTVTQLATLVNSKVNSSDYNSEITQLASDINLRVKTGDLLSQINQQAGGDTLIQVSSGKGKLYLDASSVVFGGTAFITSAMISSISADDITTGTMTAGAINLGNGTFKVDTKGNLTSSNATITGGSLKVGSNFSVNTNGILTASGATINGNLNVNSSGNLTTIDSNGFHNYDGDGNDIYIKNGTFKSTMYDEAYNATTSIEVQEGKLVAAYNDENISIYVGRQTAPVILWSDGSQIESSSGSLAVNSNKDMQLSSASGNLTLQSNGKFNINAMDGTSILSFDTYASSGWIYANNLLWAKTALRTSYLWLEGKADISGVVNCQSVNQTSLLSKKTNITKLDTQDVINAVNSTEIYEYSYKNDLEQGVSKRYASYIIDDVNEVAQYNEPSEFLSEDKKGRDDGTQLAYLTLMVQEMYKEIQELKNK
ncbi:MAG: hypothetical protein ABF575_00240 [Liquorilactobacillus hordei]|uniref:hypothetical protein n=1 Tax=Liquorilactobacillus hordei TaxID=468911 RepID=UPI0039EC4E6B